MHYARINMVYSTLHTNDTITEREVFISHIYIYIRTRLLSNNVHIDKLNLAKLTPTTAGVK